MSPGSPVSRSMRYVGHAALFLELRWHRSGGGRVAAISGTPPLAPADAASRRDAMLHTSRHVRTHVNRVIVWYFPADPGFYYLSIEGSRKQRWKLYY